MDGGLMRFEEVLPYARLNHKISKTRWKHDNQFIRSIYIKTVKPDHTYENERLVFAKTEGNIFPGGSDEYNLSSADILEEEWEIVE
jgi:hypothetical protein